MVETIQTFLNEKLSVHIVMLVITTAAMLIAMAVDLYYGVQKAKENGKARTSTGFKKTCEKARKYFAPFFVLACIDFVACIIIPFPAFCMLWAAYCIFCEFQSVREKAWQKEELRKAENTMNVIIENKDDLAKMIAKILFEKQSTLNDNDNEKDKTTAE